MSRTNLAQLLRERSRPMEPVATDVEPRLRPLSGVRAVLFDVYGTLVTSGSGDVGTAEENGKGTAFTEALAAVGLTFEGNGDDGVARLIDTIKSHQRANTEAEYPEIDIVRVWASLLPELGVTLPDHVTLQRLAIEYEVRVNPVWPMPGARETIDTLRGAGRLLGIVSNAQFFTPLLFPALLGVGLNDLGFDPDVAFYSYRYLQAKPGTFLYERAAAAIIERGLEPHDVLYVGNDLLNDVTPAARVGFRTALFAGDARSLRLRDGDPRVTGVQPDVVVTHLGQLPSIVLGQ